MSPAICDSLVAYRKNNSALQLSKPSEQWKLSLQEVKLLYLRRQYKQCAAQSTKLLRKIDDQLHAIHKAFLYYYSAISYEALGRGAHNYSSNKLPLLNLARDNFIACKASLAAALAPAPPVEKRQPRHQRSQNNLNRSHGHEHAELNDKRKTYPTTTSTAKRRRDTPILIENTANHAAYTLRAPAQQRDTPTAPRQENEQKNQKPKLMPSPLRIRKVYNDQGQSIFAYDPPSLPPTRPLPQLPSEGPQRPLPALPKLSPPSNPPHREDAVVQKPPIPPPFFRHSILAFSPYPAGPGNASINNTNLPTTLHPLLTSLSTQLEANITTIASLITKAHELQRAHNASKKNYRLASFWSFTPNYTTTNDHDHDHDNNADDHDYYNHNLIDNLAASTTATNYDSHNKNNTNDNHHNHHNQPTTPNPYPSTPTSTSTSEESRPQRIARLKADGWRGVGIKSRERGWKGADYYERVCNAALAELYGKVEMGLIG
ncbi:hypothetical protein FQN55_008921 [Onygenales sp. PD_40]|nr:hypothetical protein FQN55_008921 [Onygenales sp. PD_40]